MKTWKIHTYIKVRIKYQASFKQHSRLTISSKKQNFLFLGRYERVEAGGFLFDALEIKWTGDKFCHNLVIFHVIIFNLIYIVPICYRQSYECDIASYNTVLVKLLARVKPFSATVKMNYVDFLAPISSKALTHFSWVLSIPYSYKHVKNCFLS